MFLIQNTNQNKKNMEGSDNKNEIFILDNKSCFTIVITPIMQLFFLKNKIIKCRICLGFNK